MAQVTAVKSVSYTLTISEDEARWLKVWMQNPLCISGDPSDEDPINARMRESFWNALEETVIR